MGEFRRITYTNSGTEIDFMNGLISLICSLGDNITCEDVNGNPTTAAIQYADLTSASQATFVFNFGGAAKLTIQRRGTNDTSNLYYRVATDTAYTNDLASMFAPQYVMTVATRTFNISYYKSDDLIIIWFGWYNCPDIFNSTFSFVYLNTNSDIFYASVANHNVITSNFYNGTINGNLAPTIFNYSAGAGKIDYTEKVPFLSAGTKQFDVFCIYACSTVSQYSSIALPNGKNYFAIGTNLMVDVTEDE